MRRCANHYRGTPTVFNVYLHSVHQWELSISDGQCTISQNKYCTTDVIFCKNRIDLLLQTLSVVFILSFIHYKLKVLYIKHTIALLAHNSNRTSAAFQFLELYCTVLCINI